MCMRMGMGMGMGMGMDMGMHMGMCMGRDVLMLVHTSRLKVRRHRRGAAAHGHARRARRRAC